MGFFTNKKTGNVFKVQAGSDGIIRGPIGTPIHNTNQEEKIRLITRITNRNKEIKESHEEKIRRQRLLKAEFDKKQEQRKVQQQSIIDEIQTRRRILKQAKKDPKLLDTLQQVNPKGGILPRNFDKDQQEKQKQFFQDETGKLNKSRDNETKSINESKEIINMNNNQIQKKREEMNELKEHSSNIPEINQQNTKLINELTMEIAEYEKRNDEWNEDIEKSTESLNKLGSELQKIRFINKKTPFDTVGDLPNKDKDTLPIPDEKELAKRRAKKSFEERKFGKGVAPIFPEGFQHKVKIRDPQTGKERFTSKIPRNNKFIGFDKDHNPIFVEKEKPVEHIEPTETITPRERDEESTSQQRLSIIPGLVKEREI